MSPGGGEDADEDPRAVARALCAQAAHEIRGALGLVVAVVDELDGDRPARSAAARLSRGVERFEHLAHRYQRVADALDGGPPTAETTFDLRPVVMQALDAAGRVGGRLELAWKDTAEARVRADPALAGEALLELVLLARRLSASARATGSVTARDDAVVLELTVEAPVASWPPLPSPSSLAGLPQRPGLWSAVASLRRMRVAVGAEGPTLRLTWPTG